MAHLWTQDAEGWSARRLDGAHLELAFDSMRHAGDAQQTATGAKAAQLVRTGAGGAQVWALIAPPDSDLRMNGRAPLAGLRALADRDEIRCGGEVRYFSTETLASVESFPGAERPVYCGRCRQPIEAGSPAVRCPGCGIWYNESAELACWTYGERCAFCDQSTALDASFSWTPEEG
jgi:hypothetical protein